MATETTILVVDDEKEIADLVEIYLVSDGYQVVKANDAEEGLRLLNEYEVQLVLLDIMMPGMDGLEMCAKIRETDYVTKPFNPLELTARVKSQLRRYTQFNPRSSEEEVSPKKKGEISVRGLIINRDNHKVSVDGKEIRLTPIEFDILYLLASNTGRVFSTDEIFQNVWNERIYEATNTVMVHIRRLRGKLKEDSREDKIITTVWGVGYKIEK